MHAKSRCPPSLTCARASSADSGIRWRESHSVPSMSTKTARGDGDSFSTRAGTSVSVIGSILSQGETGLARAEYAPQTTNHAHGRLEGYPVVHTGTIDDTRDGARKAVHDDGARSTDGRQRPHPPAGRGASLGFERLGLPPDPRGGRSLLRDERRSPRRSPPARGRRPPGYRGVGEGNLLPDGLSRRGHVEPGAGA